MVESPPFIFQKGAYYDHKSTGTMLSDHTSYLQTFEAAWKWNDPLRTFHQGSKKRETELEKQNEV